MIVTLATTPQELKTALRNGWLCSLTLHGLLLLSLFPLFRQSLMTVPTEPFHWEIALVQSTQITDTSVQSVEAIRPMLASLPKRAPMPARPSNHETSPADRHVPIRPQTAEPVAPATQPNISSAAVPPIESATASISDGQIPDQPQVSDSRRQTTDMPVGSTAVEPLTAQTAEATVNDDTVRKTEPVQPVQPAANGLASEAVSTPRPDYGWLQQAIFNRLEKLKRSSRPSLDQSRPIKVMVKAVVSQEGTLLDSTVLKSSGLERIDQEAMALVQRAFPMQLDRTLDRQQIVMRIPITYSQE
jgi:periplasmic protein TonB